METFARWFFVVVCLVGLLSTDAPWLAYLVLPMAIFGESMLNELAAIRRALVGETRRIDGKAPPPAPEPPGAPDRPRTPPEDPDRLAAALLRREREELERRHFGGTA
jgi:hypothetical protein